MDCRETIQRGMDYIEDNLKTEIRADELAQAAGFSLFHYYRLFQSATGMPVMQYVLRRRLLHAIYEIRMGETKIQAALSYGFDTYAGFYKAFRREFGCTPREFLKSCRAKRPYRLQLNKEANMMVTHKKAAQILAFWGLEAEPITDIYYEESGNRNENAYYVGDAYVLKFTANLGKVKKQIELTRAIENVGLGAASLVPTADGREYVADGEVYFYLTRRLTGKQMQAASFCDAAGDARFVGEIIGQLHLALAQVETCVSDNDLLETVRAWALPEARGALRLTDADSRAFLEGFARLYSQLPRQIIHRDPNPGNIIGGDQWGFIDFELSERNVRIYDPCYAATAILSENFEKAKDTWLAICREIILGYDSMVKLTDAEWKAIPYVILANQLVCVAWFAQEEKYAELLETNVKMTRWLMDNLKRLRFDA